MTSFSTLDDLDVAGQRVFVRTDLNVPVQNGEVSDRTRIVAAATTIGEIADKGGRVLVTSHFGRPKGKASPELSLQPLANVLSECLNGRPVTFVGGVADDGAVQAMASSRPGDVLLMENVRFDPGEETNAPDFIERLAALADIYIGDAFSCSHRAHASIVGVADRLPSAAGRLMQRELEMLGKALETPQRPMAALVGGNKISTKLAVLENLVERVDRLIIGGAMANTFLAAQGVTVGTSLCEPDMADTALGVVAAAKEQDCQLILPVDATIAKKLESGVAAHHVAIDEIPADQMILDIGPRTATALEATLRDCRTLVWNGPLGAFEFAPFDEGTSAVAKAAAALTKDGDLLTVAGGGDTVAALAQAGVAEEFSYISTAGGAFLEWLEGRTLPGVAALERD